MFKFTQTRQGISANEAAREPGVTYRCAWRMCRMIRAHMPEIDDEDPLGGEGMHVEIAETMVGVVCRGKGGGGAAGKTVLFGILQGDDEMLVKVVPNIQGCHPKRVNDSAGEDVGIGGATVNSIENFWHQLRNGIRCTHFWGLPKHVETYAKEFEHRFGRRDCAEMMLSESHSTLEKPDA